MYEILSMSARYIIAIIAFAIVLSILLICRQDAKSIKKSDKFATSVLIVFFNIICYLLLSISKDKFDLNAIIFGFCSIGIIIFFNALTNFFMKNGDNAIIKCTSFLLSIGMVIQYRLDGITAFKHLLVFAISILFFLIVFLLIRYATFLNKLYILYASLSIGLLLITLILGVEEFGSKNWIRLGGYSIQPSEFVKLTIVFFMASVFQYNQKGFVKLVSQMAVVGICIGLLVLEKDLGSALLMFLITISLVFIVTSNLLYVILGFGLASAGAYASYMMFEHVRIRVEAWLNPWSDITNKTFQIAQSLFAISSGGWFGTGLKLGHPYLVPIVESDFVYAAISEEFGVFLGLAIIIVILLISYRGFKIALKTEESFYGIIAIGCSLILAFQSFIIIGGVTKFIPLTGVTLPFISYGGTSMVTSMIIVALLEGISYNNNEAVDNKNTDKVPDKKFAQGECYE